VRKSVALRAGIAPLLAALTSACASPLGPSEPQLPSGAVAISTPAAYQDWFRRTEACSGLSGDLSKVQFYVVPGVETFPTSDGPQVGEWIGRSGGHQVVIAGNYRDHEMVIRHEMLHTLLKQSGHPLEYFVSRCRLTWESWNSGNGSVVSAGWN
jgi:hypothetical protein